MRVCVYVCMCVWVYECMGVWVYGRMGAWVYGCMGVCVCVLDRECARFVRVAAPAMLDEGLTLG